MNIKGYLNKIIFHNKNNNYFILSVFLEDSLEYFESDYVTIVGNFNNLTFKEEQLYEFQGNIIEHKKYGKQFSALFAKEIVEKNEQALISYLSGNSFKGIGKKTAEILLNELGLECLDKIYDNKENLYNIKTINKKKKDIIYSSIVSNYYTQNIFLELNKYNLSNSLITKIYNHYKINTLDIIKNNTYDLIKNITGINFFTVDKIAEKNGISYDSEKRISAAIIYTLTYYCYSSGNSYLSKNQLLYNTYNVLYKARQIQIDKNTIISALNKSLENNELVEKDDKIFLFNIFHSEFFIFNDISSRIKNTQKNKYSEKLILKYIKNIEKELEIKYDETQIEAIETAINNNFSIITGGPGTGKTTITLGIIKLFQKLNNYSYNDIIDKEKNLITLCAPTGKASKKMAEATGLHASTIHKILGWTTEDKSIENFTTNNKINSKLVIIDEASMIDIFLMKNILKITNKNSCIIFIGDNDQLPSISIGNVLNDLIESEKINVIRLNKIFRQKADSGIIKLSHAIKNNLKINILDNQKDKIFIKVNKNNINNEILNLYEDLLYKKQKEKIQILIPTYKSDFGINKINLLIQDKFNKNKNQIEYGNNIFKIDDKVMQLVNNAEDNVFNGDIGIIYDIHNENNEQKVIVDYDGHFVTYKKNELNQITLSYAISIHKSQGSEFDYVIIPLVDTYNFMLNKNIMYTAITRAKKKLIILGDETVFYKSVEENNIVIRNTYLKYFFNKNKKNIEKNYILNIHNIQEIDPMIGMENITPYDFI